MNNRFRRFSAAAAGMALVVVVFPSCGRKTDPLTPDSPRPEAARIIKASARDNVAFLAWLLPVKNVEGKAMGPDRIKACQVYRAEVSGDKRKSRFKQAAIIDPAKPVNAEVSGGVVLWQDRDLRYGQVYAYQIRCEGAQGWAGPPSGEVRVAPLLTVAPPKGLVAAAGDGIVNLAWDAVTTKADGSLHEGFVGYNVYRGLAAGRYDEKPLNAEPLRTPAYHDATVTNGKTHYYIVRSVDSPVPPWRESLDSSEASAMPVKTTPPARPSGLTVVPGVGRIFLTWNENPEPDLAGYRVYRSVRSGKGHKLLTDELLKRTTYSDETVKPGVTYYYVVTAVDTAGNESAASKELSAQAERKR